MSYIGNQITTAFTSMDKQDITGNGGPNYTLSHAVANANEIEVFVNNVRQEPSVAYNASGTTLTMTGNVASTDNFYVVYQGRAVGTIVPPDGSVTSAKLDTNIAVSGNLDVGSIRATNGTAAMTIASDGKVTLPQHLLLTQYPHFEANLSSDMTGFNSHGAHGAAVAFNTTTYNIGNHFKTSGTDIGLFVVPVDGIYYFDAAAQAANTMEQSWFTLANARMNASDFVMGGAVNRISNKMIKQFSAGDKIGFHPYRAGATNLTITASAIHTWFRGGLLQAL